MKVTISAEDGEVLSTWQIAETYPENYYEDNLDSSLDDFLFITDLEKYNMRSEIEDEIVRLWRTCKRR